MKKHSNDDDDGKDGGECESAKEHGCWDVIALS